MKGFIKDEAVVLCKKSLLGQNILVDIFTMRNGLVRALGYNLKKITSRRAAHLDTGNLIKVEIKNKGDRHYLGETTLKTGMIDIKKDQGKSASIYYFLFLLKNVCPEQVPEPEIFKIYKRFIVSLSKSTNPKGLAKIYANEVLKKLGYLKKDLENEEVDAFISALIGKKLPNFDI